MVLVIILVIVAVSVLRSRSRPPEGTILANGTVEATEIDVSSKVVGHVLRLTVDEGDEVRAGQVIAVLDGDEIKAQVEQARGSYESAKARLADLERGSRVEQIRQARAGVAQAQAAAEGARRALAIAEESFAKSTELRGQLVNAQAAYNAAGQAYKEAQARLALVEAGSRPEEIQQARAGVDQARSQAVKARQDAARAEGLFAAGAISAQQRDAAVAARDSAEAALAAAEARLAELQAGSRPEEREQARAAAAQARAQLEGASRSLQVARQLYSDRLVAKQQVEAAQTQYRTALDQVAAARAQLDLLIAGPTKQ
ncbi:MAG: biotin/lipoyl-binding protein, partial [Anaerolineae bacterium]|nr:biotin/lipoyl-binding protein [Anaerolineae bacterium]